MNKKQARELLDRARAAFKMTSELVAEIVAEQAWVPLGYPSFTSMWACEFADIPLAVEVRAAVAYEMFAAEATDADVAEALHGVGEETAASLRRQRDCGVPAAAAMALSSVFVLGNALRLRRFRAAVMH